VKTVAIIQARMGSSRLPGKVLLDIGGKPMIQRVVERTRHASSLDAVVVATTSEEADRPLAEFCASMDIPFTRGSQHDLLDRYYQAALANRADIVVRVTADCPLIDPALIDQTVGLITGQQIQNTDFSCNRLPPPFSRSLPIGLDVEACTYASLERAWREATEPFHREHVMPYLYEGVTLKTARHSSGAAQWSVATGFSPRGFRIAQLHHHPDYGSLRWTVDVPADLVLVRELFARLDNHESFAWQDVLQLWQSDPDLAKINAGVEHKTMREVDERHSTPK
jgi:spore coat polysaccharide biosynthesis protein SpsF